MMNISKKNIGIIGLGNMGEAIILGLLKHVDSGKITGFDKDQNKCKKISDKIKISDSGESLIQNSDIIVLAVKPDIIPLICKDIKDSISNDKIIISIAAGITIASIEKIIGSDKKVIRVMPNTPALVNEGMTAISNNNSVNKQDLELGREIFSSIGKVIIVDEKYLDAVTAVSGCGPAYVFTIIQALADAGVKLGLSRQDSELLASQTLYGAAKMVMETKENPISLRNKVTSPGGSTIEAVFELEKSGLSGILISAVEKAEKKSRELGETK